MRSGPPISSPLRARNAGYLLEQLRLKIREIKVLSVGLNFSLLVDLKNTDTIDEEDISRLDLKT